MLEAVTKWIPIYSAGAIDPYYYPRLRDGVFQRTMLIAPKTAAVVSSSVQMATDETLNLFITDKRAITALTKEYEGYFTLCRPLMRIYTNRQKRDLLQDMSELSNKDGDAIACHTITRSEYLAHLEHLRHLENQYENLMAIERNDLPRNLLLHVKDSVGAVIAKSDRPTIAFMIGERIMVNSLWTYLCKKAR